MGLIRKGEDPELAVYLNEMDEVLKELRAQLTAERSARQALEAKMVEAKTDSKRLREVINKWEIGKLGIELDKAESQLQAEREAHEVTQRALEERTKQLGVACDRHDLVHTLACGLCLRDVDKILGETTDLLLKIAPWRPMQEWSGLDEITYQAALSRRAARGHETVEE